MNREVQIGRLYTEMYKECKRLLNQVGYVPEWYEVVMNSTKLQVIIRVVDDEYIFEQAYRSALEDLEQDYY